MGYFFVKHIKTFLFYTIKYSKTCLVSLSKETLKHGHIRQWSLNTG